MDTFKTKPGIPEEILITEENFANETGRQFPYAMKKNEKITYKAVCPACDNLIQIIGLFKREEEVKRKPYGRHTTIDLPGLTVYSEEDYLNCPKRKPGNKKSQYFYNLMKEHFDLIVLILEKKLQIYVSYHFAETLLRSWRDNEGWRYYDTNYNNLPYMLLFAEMARFISPAAALVKVMTKILSGGIWYCSIRYCTLFVITRVFPDPGPASTIIGPSLCITAFFWT